MLSLVIFTSTKGHWDHTNIYQHSLNHLNRCINPDTTFVKKIVHIKNTGTGEPIDKMVDFYRGHGFLVIQTDEDFKHHQDSFHSGYLKDIVKAYAFIESEYVLHLEDDWIFQYQIPLTFLFDTSINVLRKRPEILNVRFCHHLNEIERINGLGEKHGMYWAKAIPSNFSTELFLHNDNWSFNPHIARTRDYQLASLVLKRNLAQLSFNCEMGFAKIMRGFSDAELHLSAFNPDIASVKHLGIKDFTPEMAM